MLLRTASIGEQDIIEAALWLNQQQWGDGADFLATTDDMSAATASAPLACPTLVFPNTRFRTTIRWRFVGRFPYLAIFTVEQEILIVGVLHNRRDLESILRARVGISGN